MARILKLQKMSFDTSENSALGSSTTSSTVSCCNGANRPTAA